MTREDAMKIIYNFKDKCLYQNTLDVFIQIEEYCTTMDTFKLNILIDFIDFKRPNKLGGIYIELNKGLDALKKALKKYEKECAKKIF